MDRYDIAILGDDLAGIELARHACQNGLEVVMLVAEESDLSSFPYAAEVFAGEYSIVDERLISVQHGAKRHLIEAAGIVIATGTETISPNWAIDHKALVFGADFHQLPSDCEDVLIIGCGKTGLRVRSQMYNRVATLTCVEAGQMPDLPSLQTSMNRGRRTVQHCYSHNAVIGMEAVRDRLNVYLEDGTILQTQQAVICTEQHGRTAHLNLGAVGLMPDDRGKLWCDESLETWKPGIYALGNVVGYPEIALEIEQQASLVLNSLVSTPLRCSA